jgi:hypothetical protein
MDVDEILQQATRRQFLRRGAVAAGGVAAAGLFQTASAIGGPARDPRPVPGGFTAGFELVPSDPAFHLFPPYVGFEMSTITDFKGVVAGTEIQGTAHASDGRPFTFDADMRFMQGTYVGLDGRVHDGTFGFV